MQSDGAPVDCFYYEYLRKGKSIFMRIMFKNIIKALSRLFNPPKFVIKLRKERVEVVRGKVSRPFLDECTHLCRDNNICSGQVFGVNCEYGIRLEFSDDIPENMQQRFRNIWNSQKN